jgi:hypothetical protein
VDGCDAISVILKQCLLNLEELKIKNCGGLQEVFKIKVLLTREGEQHNVLLSRLKEIWLHDLPELRCIWKGPTKLINLNNLEHLEVIGCKKLIHLFTPTLAQSLQNLKFLEIGRCDELEYLIAKDEEDQILSASHLQPLCFPKLEKVKVNECNKLKRLFPMTIIDSLLVLENLEVKGASQLVEIFAHEDDKEIVVQKDVTLPQLRKISLEQLPCLVSFCPRNYHVILPDFWDLEVQRCLNMTTSFTHYVAYESVQINREVPIIPAVFIFIFIFFHSITSSITTTNNILLITLISCLVWINTLL